MKRDFDLIRSLLIEIENCENIEGNYAPMINGHKIDGHKIDEHMYTTIEYHLQLLFEAKLIKGTHRNTMMNYSKLRNVNLTWAGHDFLDSARNDKVWNLAIQKLKDTVGSASIEVLKKVLVSSTLELLGTNGI